MVFLPSNTERFSPYISFSISLLTFFCLLAGFPALALFYLLRYLPVWWHAFELYKFHIDCWASFDTCVQFQMRENLHCIDFDIDIVYNIACKQ